MVTWLQSPHYEADKAVKIILEVLGAAGFKDIKKTIGEEGRLIDFYELEERIQKDILEQPARLAAFTEAARLTANMTYARNGSQSFDGAGVGVAVIDSGIATHNDLFDAGIAQYSFLNGATPNLERESANVDPFGHGTHVAGTACAEDNDNGDPNGPYGVVGVAPACALYGLRVLDDDGFGDASDLIGAPDLQRAIDESTHADLDQACRKLEKLVGA